MLGQVGDALGQDRNLDLGAAGVAIAAGVVGLITAVLRSAVIVIRIFLRDISSC
jgi:hypothetical protein